MRRGAWAASLAVLLAVRPLAAQPPGDSTLARAALPPDRWLGSDKVKHVFMAGLTTAATFSGVRLAGIDRRPALGVAVGAAAVVAVGKEVRDRRVTGRFSARDLVADALGVLAYGALLARTPR